MKTETQLGTTSHTPGPWAVAEYDDEQVEVICDEVVHVAFCNNSPRGRANARLIAAAPKLLSELKAFLIAAEEHRTPMDLTVARAIAAIEKAEGRE